MPPGQKSRMDRNKDLAKQFIDFISIGASPKTIKDYRLVIDRFTAWLDENGKDATRITVADIGAFMRELNEASMKKRGKELGNAAKRTYLSILSSFYNHLIEHIECMHAANPARKPLRQLKIAKPQPGTVLERKELDLLIQGYDTAWPRTQRSFPPDRQRDLTLIMLLGCTGIRRIEASRLNVRDVNFEEGIITVFGKGSKKRSVPMLDAIVELMKHYIEDTRPQYPSPQDEQALFLVANPARNASDRMRPEYITYRMRRLFNIIRGSESESRGLGPHTLRRSFGTWLLADSGGDLRLVQTILGHESVETTQRYAQINDQEAALRMRTTFRLQTGTDQVS